ncbi:MAG: hypothetical protein WCV73_05140 [Patescibacteria group bacterium]|jgi:hypothetical protein
MKPKFVPSVIKLVALCIVIGAVSIYFVDKATWMGPVLVLLGLVCIVALLLFKIKLKATLPDIFFGALDNGILAILAIIGARLAGVAGAIMGGVAGNAITDGIAGFFEGYSAEKLRLQNVSEKRTMLKSAVGKMAGCLLGAGIVLTIASFIKF